MRHVELEELLAVRDGAGGAEATAHVAGCARCGAELERLRRVAEALRALPEEGPDEDLWPTLARRIGEERWRRRWLRAGIAVAGVFLSITVLTLVRGGIEAWREAGMARERSRLVAHSQQLEASLREAERRSVVDGRTAGAMMEIEDRIAAIDTRLLELQQRGARPDETINLWRQRISLLDTLVELHTSPPTYAGL